MREIVAIALSLVTLPGGCGRCANGRRRLENLRDQLHRRVVQPGSCARHVIFHWTLTGTNTGPGGAGKAVRISGYELWTLGGDGLIAASQGHFDAAEYQRQLKEGP